MDKPVETVDNAALKAAPDIVVAPGPGNGAGGSALPPGEDRLGRYRIVREIARSNDIVWEGVDPAMNRRVAVKELNLPTTVGDDARQTKIERFYREARAAGAMNHPNIVTIHEVGEDNGRFFIAMEYLEGQTLRKRFGTHPTLPEQTAAQVVVALCDALAYAHERGVIHRDIKPDNVFVSDPGPDGRMRVKLTDFGIARIAHEETLTAAGTFFGTPAYMSPEQLSGRGTADARSDLFSLGVMLWEMVMGRKPFSGESVPATMFKILNDPTPHAENASPELQLVIERATAKNPAHRYQTAAEMRADLEPIAEGRAGRAGSTAAPSAAAAGTTRGKALAPEEGSVVAIEVVDFDGVPAAIRPKLLAGLLAIAKGTEEVKRAEIEARLLLRSTPTGVLIALFLPDTVASVRCAVEIDRSFRQMVTPLEQQAKMPLRLRVAVGHGMVQRTDNPADDVTGEGVAVTRRLLRLADVAPGGILVTAAIAQEALKKQPWPKHLTDLSFRDAGGGLRLHVYNLHGVDFGGVTALPALGGPDAPAGKQKAYRPPMSRRAVRTMVLVPLLLLGGGYYYLHPAQTTGWAKQGGALAKQGLISAVAFCQQITAAARRQNQAEGHDVVVPIKSAVHAAAAGKPKHNAAAAAAHPAPALRVPNKLPDYRDDPFVTVGGGPSRTKKVRIPNVTGLMQDEALRRIESAGLVAADAHTEYSNTIPENQVFHQRPAPGTIVPAGSAVRLAVSLGPDTDAGGTVPANTPDPRASDYPGDTQPTPVPSDDDVTGQ